jgi:uncharacterized protein YdhG (YjbR/CyaY superfamily)
VRTSPEVDAYIAAVPEKFRQSIKDLRGDLHAALATRGRAFEECMSYAMPGLRLTPGGRRGPMVAGFAAHRTHCSLYPHSGSVLPGLAALIGARRHTRSALHFTPEDPVPPALLAAVLDARLAETG